MELSQGQRSILYLVRQVTLGGPVKTDTKALGSSPYCRWTPFGGVNGTLIVSGCFNREGDSATGSDYFVSHDYSHTWETFDHPLPYYSQNIGGTQKPEFVGYSNSFCISYDGMTLFAINNVNINNNPLLTKIRFARVKI